MRNYLFIFLILFSVSYGNPFLIDFPEKKDVTPQDYLEIEDKLREKSIFPFLEKYYPKSTSHSTQKYKEKDDFSRRMSRGLNQILVKDGKEPVVELVKINQGGDQCIVCCVPLDEKYVELISRCKESLKRSGYNGYFYHRVGGFPNPTGREIRYCGVPYCFKVFLMLEANALGFDKVLWVDSAMEALRDPEPLFHWLKKKGAFLIQKSGSSKTILPKTREILLRETGVDPLKVPFIRTQVFGLDFSQSHVQKFVEDYYKMVEIGTPFCSCYPEEFVFTALIGKNPKKWEFQPFVNLIEGEDDKVFKKRGRQGLLEKGVFFLILPH